MTVVPLEISSTQTLAHFIMAKVVMSVSQSTLSAAGKQLNWLLGTQFGLFLDSVTAGG